MLKQTSIFIFGDFISLSTCLRPTFFWPLGLIHIHFLYEDYSQRLGFSGNFIFLARVKRLFNNIENNNYFKYVSDRCHLF